MVSDYCEISPTYINLNIGRGRNDILCVDLGFDESKPGQDLVKIPGFTVRGYSLALELYGSLVLALGTEANNSVERVVRLRFLVFGGSSLT